MYNVLIVDDEKIVRIALKTIINWEDNGFRIVGEAKDGINALEVIKKNKIDIVITDLKMPNMDGIELIKCLQDKGYNGKILVLSNYDDYNLVREAMKMGASDYLLKVVIEEEEFLQSLKQIAHQLDKDKTMSLAKEKITENNLIVKEAFLKNLIMNKYSKREITENIHKLDIKFNEEGNIVLFVFIDKMRSPEIKKRIKDKKMFEMSIINIISELVKDPYDGEVIGLEYRDFVVIIPVNNTWNNLDERMKQLSCDISEMIQTYLNVTSSIAIGNLCDGAGIPEMVKKCRNAINYKFYFGHKSIIKLDDINYDNIIVKQDYSSVLIQLKENLRMGEIEKNIDIFDDIFEKAKTEKWNPYHFKKVMSVIIDNLVSILVEIGEKDILYIDANKNILQNSETIEEYRQNVINLMEGICKRIEHIYNSKYRKEVSMAIEYIKQNLDKKLSLKIIAEKINMNESYMSRIFKNETGESLIKFINHMKIEKAKEIIRNSDDMIKEVAESVGISDQFYFDRIFKKHVGMSPSQYKNKVYK